MRYRAALLSCVLMLACSPDDPAPLAGPGAELPAAAKKPPSTSSHKWARVFAGDFETCALDARGDLYCWGNGEWGQQGNGSIVHTTQPTQPVQLPPGKQIWVDVSVGGSFVCGIARAPGGGSDAYCWGRNFFGEHGTGLPIGPGVATGVPGQRVHLASSPKFLDAGYEMVCGTDSPAPDYIAPITRPVDRHELPGAKCWGLNRYGQIGQGDRENPACKGFTPAGGTGGPPDLTAYDAYPEPRRVQESCPDTAWMKSYLSFNGPYPDHTRYFNFDRVSTGYAHVCGVIGGITVECWGLNNFGQLGRGSVTPSVSSLAQPLANNPGITSVSAGLYHTCGLTSAGKAYCWGKNNTGELGDGTFVDRYVPTPVLGNLTFAEIHAGAHHTCGRTTAKAGNNVYCWGLGGFGGDSTTATTTVPTPVAGTVHYQQISTASEHTCGIIDDQPRGQLLCWGHQRFGEVGVGSTALDTTVLAPTPVLDP